MTEAEARARALAFATDTGHDPAQYVEPELEFADDEWRAFFRGKNGAPGNHFSVVVADDGGDTRLVEGR